MLVSSSYSVVCSDVAVIVVPVAVLVALIVLIVTGSAERFRILHDAESGAVMPPFALMRHGTVVGTLMDMFSSLSAVEGDVFCVAVDVEAFDFIGGGCKR